MSEDPKAIIQLIVSAELAAELKAEFGEEAEVKPYTGTLPESLAFGTGLVEVAAVLTIAANAIKIVETAGKAAGRVQAWRQSKKQARTVIIAVGLDGPEAIDLTEETSEIALAKTFEAAARPV